jgi:hypothetical protein
MQATGRAIKVTTIKDLVQVWEDFLPLNSNAYFLRPPPYLAAGAARVPRLGGAGRTLSISASENRRPESQARSKRSRVATMKTGRSRRPIP